jgi:hypothetical protein
MTGGMSTEPGTEPVEDNEILYRRIPVSRNWYSNGGLSPDAFEPRDDEPTGISFSRAKYKTIHEAAKGKGKLGYYVAEFLAGDLLAHGIDVVPRPLQNDPSHAELPGLTTLNRDTTEELNRRKILAGLFRSVYGPFVEPVGGSK